MKSFFRAKHYLIFLILIMLMMTPRNYAQKASPTENKTQAEKDAKHQRIASGIIDDPQYAEFGIYEQTAARPESATPIITRLPLELPKGARIALIGNGICSDADRRIGTGNVAVSDRDPSIGMGC